LTHADRSPPTGRLFYMFFLSCLLDFARMRVYIQATKRQTDLKM